MAAPNLFDVIVVWAYRSASVTPPTIPAGYNTIQSGGANTNSAVLVWKFSDGTETDTGTFTNATTVVAHVYRGCDKRAPIGLSNQNGGTGATITYSAIAAPLFGNSTSWFAGFGANRTTMANTAPTGMTIANAVVTHAGSSDTNGTAASWASAGVAGNSNTGWRSAVVELVAAQNSTTLPTQVVQHVAFQSNENFETGNGFKYPLANKTKAGNCLIIGLTYAHSASRTITITDDVGGNTYTAVLGTALTDGGSVFDSNIYYALNITAGISVITVTFDTAIDDVICQITEVKGIATSSVIDGTPVGTNTAGPTCQSGSITTTTDGDFLYTYGQDVSWGAGMEGLHNICFMPDANWHVLFGDTRVGSYTACGIQTTHGAINPTVYMNNNQGDTLSMIGVAFKTDATKGAGRSAGIQIVKVCHTRINPLEVVQSFATAGNLTVMMTAYEQTQINLNSVKDSVNGAWTVLAPGAGFPQSAYIQNSTADPTTTIMFKSVDGGAGNIQLLLYDIIGAATASFDTSSTDSGGTESAGATIAAAAITPTTANGLILSTMALLTGPPSSMPSPSGGFFQSVYYTGATDLTPQDSGDCYGHYFNPTTSPVAFSYVDVESTTGWAHLAVAFKAPSGGAVDALEWKTSAVMPAEYSRRDVVAV